MTKLGPLFGYYPNPSKTHLVVKEEYKEIATQVFADTGVQITTDGKRHLGAAIGSHSYTIEYVSGKVQEWTEEVIRLAQVAKSQPHAAYAAFTHGLASKWTYLLRTIPEYTRPFAPSRDSNPSASHSCSDRTPTMLQA